MSQAHCMARELLKSRPSGGSPRCKHKGHTHTHTHTHTNTHTRTHAHTHAHAHAHTYAHAHAHAHVREHARTHVHTHTHMHTRYLSLFLYQVFVRARSVILRARSVIYFHLPHLPGHFSYILVCLIYVQISCVGFILIFPF